MDEKVKGYITAMWVMVILSVILMQGRTAYAIGDGNQKTAPENVRAVRNSNTSVRISWKPDAEVDGYIIYRYDRSAKKYVKVKVVRDSSADRWIDRKLKTNKVYRYKVASYRMVDGKKQVSALSDWVSARTYKRYSKSVNAQAPKVDKKKVNLGLCSSQKLKSRVVATRYGKNKKKKPFSDKVRWYSSDTSIATVDQNGVVKAGAAPGSCSIYAKAHNGAKTEVKVNVKNYAKEDDFYNYSREDDIYTLITDFKPQIQDIAEYYSIHRIGEGNVIYMDLDDHANVVITPENADIGNLREDIEKLLVEFPYYISIEVYCDRVEYILRKEDSDESLKAYVVFWFDNDCNEWWSIQVGPHWTAYRFYPH
ncbi:MAG: Ig-like domain-containing protein [Lachnospiraceae bacterium]|nr:Ig-like domain-containing protein [Lachnospiraceae bacterium]